MLNLLRKLKSFLLVFREYGSQLIFLFLGSKCKLVISRGLDIRWKLGIASEIKFWDNYLKVAGAQFFQHRNNPELALQHRPASLLSNQLNEVQILDVGAGPLTVLGKKSDGKNIYITAIDPLAHAYDKLLNKFKIQPLVRTICLSAEDLPYKYSPCEFDLVYARNSIDHTYNPEMAVRNMIDVVKVGSYVLLEHKLNEADHQNWKGLHQWNFFTNKANNFLIGSRHKEVKMTEKYADTCNITCEVLQEGIDQMLIVRIQKK